MIQTVEAEWAKENAKDINIIDIRPRKAFKKFNLEGSKNVPFNDLVLKPEKYLNKDEFFYIICSLGSWTEVVIRELWKKGYVNLIQINGGINAIKNLI